jgi:hypothetical protein
MEKEFTPGPTTESMKASGEPTRCTVKVHFNGLMGENILENTRKIKKKVTESSSGQTEGVTEENG